MGGGRIVKVEYTWVRPSLYVVFIYLLFIYRILPLIENIKDTDNESVYTRARTTTSIMRLCKVATSIYMYVRYKLL